jgi:hypothetical protein
MSQDIMIGLWIWEGEGGSHLPLKHEIDQICKFHYMGFKVRNFLSILGFKVAKGYIFKTNLA